MKIDPKRLRLYAVTDRAWTHDAEGLLRQVAAAVDGGAGIVQLREKHMGQADFLAEAERFVALCRERALSASSTTMWRSPPRPGRTAFMWARRIWRRAGLGSCWGRTS